MDEDRAVVEEYGEGRGKVPCLLQACLPCGRQAKGVEFALRRCERVRDEIRVLADATHAIPHVFCKCAQAHEKGRVSVIFGETVCEKCSDAIEKTALAELQFAGPERLRGVGYPTPPSILHEYQKKWVKGGGFCMNIKYKGDMKSGQKRANRGGAS